ncbi:GAF domain-containing protein [bacterium]|nr:MAG: GAF domain-containing protein [bacterium]
MLLVPIILGDKKVGVISVNHEKSKIFSYSDEMLLKNIANYAAIAIERSFEIDIISKASQELFIANTEEEILTLMLKAATQLTHTKNAIIFLIDKTLKIKSNTHIPDNFQYPIPQIHKKDNLTREIFETSKTIIIENIKCNNRVHPGLGEYFYSMIGIPIKLLNDNLGVLYVFDDKNHYFFDSEKSMLKLLSKFTASALFNTARKKELEIINKIGQIIIGQDCKKIAELIYLNTKELISSNDFFLCTYDKKQKSFKYIYWIEDGKEIDDSKLSLISVKKDSFTYHVIESKEYLLIKDWKNQKLNSPFKPKIITRTQRSWLGVPLKIGDEVLGVISVQNKSPNIFDEETVRLLDIIANQTAVVIKNKDLLNEVKRYQKFQISAINQISDTIAASTFGLQEMLKTIVIWLSKISNCERNIIEIGLVLPETNEIELFYFDEEKYIKEFRHISDEEQYILSKKSNNPEQNLFITYSENNNISAKYKLLINENGVIGFIKFVNEPSCQFNEFDKMLIDSISKLTVVALEMEKLYKNIMVREQILTKNHTAFDFMHRFRNTVGTIPVWIQFIHDKLKNNKVFSDEIVPYIDKITKDINNLLTSVDKLSEKPQKSVININHILNSITNYIIVKIYPEEKISLETEIDPNLHKIVGFADDMLFALQTIVDNAIESMNDSCGQIYIEAKNGEKSVNILIRDTGIGIKKENLRSIFSPLFSTKEQGHGYGLWRSKILIEDMKGKILVNSKLGNGTEFKIELPSQ